MWTQLYPRFATTEKIQLLVTMMQQTSVQQFFSDSEIAASNIYGNIQIYGMSGVDQIMLLDYV